MPKNFFSPHNMGADWLDLANDIRLGTPTAVFGVSAPHRALIAATCFEKRLVYVCDNAQTAARTAEEIAGFSGEQPALLTAKDEVLLYKDAVSKDALFRRLNALYEISRGAKCIVADVEALMQIFPKKLPVLKLKEGEDVDFSSLASRLTAMGYVRSAAVESKGAFALRGDILDIFPVNAENPARVDFFGDTAEKIKPYNFITGERLPLVKELSVCAATDVFFEEGEQRRVKEILFGELSDFKDAAAYNRASAVAGEISAKLEGGAPFGGASFLLPVLENAAAFDEFIGGAVYVSMTYYVMHSNIS